MIEIFIIAWRLSMRKAIVVGGSNGIGLAVTNSLIKEGYFVNILDIVSPDEKNIIDIHRYDYKMIDLLHLDIYDLKSYEEDPDINFLMITAGFGRVAPFSSISHFEISDLMQVNATSAIQILKYFYKRIQSKEDFYAGVMVSIAGMISSPLFSVYAGSKAALNRFIESVNIELEESGTRNRILNVSPGSIKGTAFNGGQNDLSLNEKLASDILNHLFEQNTLYIPEYEETFRSVTERYQNDPHQFGLDSYQYKMSSGRVQIQQKETVVGYLSGTFDLFHVGHLNLLKRAKSQCDYLIVGIHPNAAHKGKKTFISFEERLEIIKSNRYVDKAVESFQEDSDAWDEYHYNKLFVGSDYKGTERFNNYEKYFSDKGVEIVYFPYTQGTSSTELRRAIAEINRVEN